MSPSRSWQLTYLLTPWSTVLLDKLTGFQLVKKFPAFYGARRFITAFASAQHMSLSWASSIHSIPPHPTSWISILIFSPHLCLSLPSGFFPSCFPTKTLYTPLLTPIRATCPAHLILLLTNWGNSLIFSWFQILNDSEDSISSQLRLQYLILSIFSDQRTPQRF